MMQLDQRNNDKHRFVHRGVRSDATAPGTARHAWQLVVIVTCCTLASWTWADDASTFNRDVQPILAEHCLLCHGPDESIREGGLRLDSFAAAIRGGDSGEPAIVPSNVTASVLLQRIISDDPDVIMPPPDHHKPLSNRQKQILSNWIANGGQYERHWSLKLPHRPATTDVAATEQHPIDVLVDARLQQQPLIPSPSATPEILCRRLYLDLIGIPPSVEAVRQFVQDAAVDEEATIERLADELLMSPQFGVRWARHWLDLARYADSHGFQRDDLRDLWPYRDWVVDAMNSDMPFDQFTVEQLAGDLLTDATEDQHIATGFNRCTTCNVEAGTEPEKNRVNQVFDRVNTVGAVWLGLTLECAQCHDHKFDPVTMQDYYRLFAFFNNTEIEAQRANKNKPGSIKFLGPYRQLTNPSADTQTTKQEEQTSDPSPPQSLVMVELSEPRQTSVLIRGVYTNPGEVVAAGTPSALHPLETTGGTRLDLARWLVSRKNPLTARVVVNRWWAELFGRGLVPTVEDFGVKGTRPVHPDLLDWLAVEFMDNGWSMKYILRTIVTSQTYRRSSRASAKDRMQDDQNQWLARGPRFRMDAEMIRDNALAIGGLLSLERGGPPIRPPQPAGLWDKVGGEKYDYQVSDGETQYRRGLYVVLKRGSPYPAFVNFDAGARMTCVVRRSRSNTPLQALTLLNDPVFVQAAMAFAKRITEDLPQADDEQRLLWAFRTAVARLPSKEELDILQALLERERTTSGTDAAWVSVAVTLLNLDETITKG
jgi:Protein of unknown function (DUF1553)/Protein of unknown function (DUF1549)/Planctomycete cytochrome C